VIATACSQASAKDPNAQAIIAADQNVKHGDVIGVIDLIRNNGLVRFAINVKQSDIVDGSGG
jgi:biopolymer transport protein ExbD